MKKVMVALSLFSICALFIGCVSINSMSISHITPEKGNFVKAEASGIGFYHLTIPDVDDLEREALSELKSYGALKNITVRLTTRDYYYVQQYTVIVTGEQ